MFGRGTVVADVYAGDNAVPRGSSGTSVLFLVIADHEPDALLRVATQLRIGNVLPSSGTLAMRDDGLVVMTFEISGLSEATVDFIRRKLLQLTTIHSVDALAVRHSLGSS